VVHAPHNHDDLLSFVAHFGARVTRAVATSNLENVALRAVAASRRDPALARMLPVFLWRVRDDLNLDELTTKAVRQGCAPVLGYYLEVATKAGSVPRFKKALSTLRRHAHVNRPVYLFRQTRKYPFEAMAAMERTPDVARRWGLLTSTPLDSFETYFHKVASL
jgi:hypothetical protein